MASQQQKNVYILYGGLSRGYFSHIRKCFFSYLSISLSFSSFLPILLLLLLSHFSTYYIFYFVVKQRMNEQKKTFWEQKKNMLQNIIIRVAHGRVEESRKKLLLLFCVFQLKNQLIMLYRVCIILFLCASGVCFSSHMRAALYHSYVHKKTSY